MFRTMLNGKQLLTHPRSDPSPHSVLNPKKGEKKKRCLVIRDYLDIKPTGIEFHANPPGIPRRLVDKGWFGWLTGAKTVYACKWNDAEKKLEEYGPAIEVGSAIGDSTEVELKNLTTPDDLWDATSWHDLPDAMPVEQTMFEKFSGWFMIGAIGIGSLLVFLLLSRMLPGGN